MTDLLTLDRLCIETDDGKTVVENLNLALPRASFSALVGESGSGKSVAARALLGLLPPGLKRAAGRIHFDGTDLTSCNEAELRKVRGPGIGMVFQEPMTSLNPAMTVGEQIAEGLRLHDGLSGRPLRDAVLDMMRRVGIREAETRMYHWPHQFSGGMRQRIMLASAMAMRPKLLIADEPTTALDTVTQADIMALMVALTREHNSAVLLISHDLCLVGAHADHVHVLQRGRLVEKGATADLLSRPKHVYTKRLIDALPKAKEARARTETEVVAALHDVTLHYGTEGWLKRQRGPRVLDKISLEIHAGEVVALVGSSGSGKSTIGRAILRLSDVTSGQVQFLGQNITGARGAGLGDLRARAQLVHQDPYDSLNPRMQAGEIVAEPLLRTDLSLRDRQKRLEEDFARVGLDGFQGRLPHQLSGGQRQRLAIARALIRRPSFVVADEPVSALDMTVQRQVMAILTELQRDYGFACLFISHDFGVVSEIADRVIVLDQGRIVERGTTQDVLRSPQSETTQRLLHAMPIMKQIA